MISLEFISIINNDFNCDLFYNKKDDKHEKQYNDSSSSTKKSSSITKSSFSTRKSLSKTPVKQIYYIEDLELPEIDTIMKLGMAHPMGPLQLADFIGLDVCLAILKVLHDGFGNPKYAPSPLLVNMVTSGDLGVKSGRGFYDYSHGTKDLIVAPGFTKN
jgi:hypothetical protein